MGLLWLALCSTAVLPWAHELGHLAHPSHLTHRTDSGPASAPAQSAGPNEAEATAAVTVAATDVPDGDPIADTCLVCLHLWGQHLSPAATSALTLAAAQQPVPPRSAASTHHPPPSWLTPAPRAPPHLNA